VDTCYGVRIHTSTMVDAYRRKWLRGPPRSFPLYRPKCRWNIAQRTVEFERTGLPKGSRLKLTVAPEPGSMTLLKRFSKSRAK
jgi:hypothetical protein